MITTTDITIIIIIIIVVVIITLPTPATPERVITTQSRAQHPPLQAFWMAVP
jgi:hypothetical protein